MDLTTTQISQYDDNRSIKHHENKMLNLILDNLDGIDHKILDIGCADGLFCKSLHKSLPDAKITGIDLSVDLIKRANAKQIPNCSFEITDVRKYNPRSKFNIVIASGILSAFQEFPSIIDTWISWLDKNGVLFVFGRFNTEDIDTQIKFRNNFNNSDWEGGYTAYSIQTISKFLNEKSVSYNFTKFNLDIDLPKTNNPVQTYTVNTTDGRKLIINGANLIADFYFLVIKKKSENS